MDQQQAINILGQAMQFALTRGIFNDDQQKQIRAALDSFQTPGHVPLAEEAHQSGDTVFEGDERIELHDLNERISLS